MNNIFRKCPVCKQDAILQETGPDFKKGYYRRIFKCKKGHTFAEKLRFCKCGKPEIEVIEGGWMPESKGKPNEEKEDQIPKWLKEINEFVKSLK